MVSATLFNEVRFQSRATRSRARRTATNPEGVVQQGGTTVLTIGRNNFSPRETTIKRWQVADTLTWSRGRAQAEGRLRLPVRRHPEPLPRILQRRRTRSAAWPRSPAAGRTARTSSTSRTFAGPGHDRRGDASGHPRVLALRAGRMAADARPDGQRSGLRYDLMKTARRRCRNPDPQLAAAGIDTSRLDADTNNFGPRLGVAWSPLGTAVTWCAAAGGSSTAGRPRSCSGTAHSNNGVNIVSLTFTGDAVPTYPQKFDDASRPAGPRRGRPSSTSTRTSPTRG